jgi:hypothetical protein
MNISHHSAYRSQVSAVEKGLDCSNFDVYLLRMHSEHVDGQGPSVLVKPTSTISLPSLNNRGALFGSANTSILFSSQDES